MFSLNNMPTTTSVFSTYTTFAALVMVIRTVFNEIRTMANHLIPQQLQEKILSKLGGFLGNFSSQMTLMIDEQSGLSINEIYQASELYLRTKITPSIERLKVSKAPKEKNLSVTMNKGEKIVDVFEGIHLRWELVCNESQKSYFDQSYGMQAYEKSENRTLELSFNKKFKERVLDTYLPYVVDRSKEIKLENKVVKLHSIDFTKGDNCGGPWEPINLHHPSTFDTLAMDPALKKELIDDLDRFVKRREFYRKVGKAWKRGYFFYGPPGTGKSSLVAAMANYLKFDIYDLELTNVRTNLDLRRLLLSTANGSIIVIEDIDCSITLQDRKEPPQGQRFGRYGSMESQVTLSGLLNFIDGLWSSCGDEKIIVFTTNHKDRLDSALLRPGRMDKHIHLSYCTPSGFKILASNYLGINSHNLFAEIKELITEVEVTPAEIAEELMKSEDVDFVLKGLVKFLQRKKVEAELIMSNIEGQKEVDEKGKES